MKTTLSLSVDAICDTVYAAAALRALMMTDDVRPAMLAHDRRPLLSKMVRSTMVEMLAGMAGALECCDPGTGDDNVEVTLELRPGASASTLRHLLEEAVGALTVRNCYMGAHPSVAASYDANARSLLEGASAMIARTQGNARFRLTPRQY